MDLLRNEGSHRHNEQEHGAKEEGGEPERYEASGNRIVGLRTCTVFVNDSLVLGVGRQTNETMGHACGPEADSASAVRIPKSPATGQYLVRMPSRRCLK